MYLNGQRVDETWFASGNPNGGHYYYDQGSRTMVSQTDWTSQNQNFLFQIFHMNEGDTLHIEVAQASSEDYFLKTTFCITLSTWDYWLLWADLNWIKVANQHPHLLPAYQETRIIFHVFDPQKIVPLIPGSNTDPFYKHQSSQSPDGGQPE